MISADSWRDLPEDFQGIVIEGPAEVTFHRRKVGRAIWDRSTEEAFDYVGDLDVEGTVQIYTPEDTQYATWFRFEKRLSFVVKNLSDGSTQTTSHVDGGWNLAREGVSVQMAPNPADAVSEEEFNTASESGKMIRKHFIFSIDDHLPTLYSSPTMLEIHATYLGLQSNTIRVKVNVDNGDGG